MKGEPVPGPIAPVGIAQVFADAECREYANGTVNKVYVRINGGPFEFGDLIHLGSGANSLEINTPTAENPDDGYSILAYQDFLWDSESPIAQGTIAECSAPPSVTIDVTGKRTIWYGNE